VGQQKQVSETSLSGNPTDQAMLAMLPDTQISHPAEDKKAPMAGTGSRGDRIKGRLDGKGITAGCVVDDGDSLRRAPGFHAGWPKAIAFKSADDLGGIYA